MTNVEFYRTVSNEIDEILKRFEDDEILKSKNDPNTRRSYGFLLWFLENNLTESSNSMEELRQYIVDGNDDNSCDLIFPNKEGNETVYYVIQAKWFAESKYNNSNEISNIYKACLTDFTMMLNHEKALSEHNTKFNEMYKKLQKHISDNNKVRFLLVAMCLPTIDARIKEINEAINNELVTTEIYDMSSMKNTYIDINYRGYVTDNPLAATLPVNGKIDIRFKESGSLEVKKDQNYIFLLGAEEIYNLYKKYGTCLFLKNVRNPLKVDVNKQMSKSAKEEPESFFNYNNGITAITKKVYPFYSRNNKVSIQGIQIINGAQTVKSVYDAYEAASPSARKKMRERLIISMKVVVVDDNKLERNIIQYTNTQNKIEQRDYHSNDLIQEEVYYFLLKNTEIIYARKNGEFDNTTNNANQNIVSNVEMAQAYIACEKQNPYLAKTSKKQIFDSNYDIYDDVFNDKMNKLSFYNSYKIYKYVDKKVDEFQSLSKSDKDALEKYTFLKDGKYYLAALLLNVYFQFDDYLEKQYIDSKKSGKSISKEEIGTALIFSQFPKNEKMLDKSFRKAVEIIMNYVKEKGIKDGGFYKQKNTYDEIVKSIIVKTDSEVETA